MSAIAGIYHLNEEPINLHHGSTMMKAFEKFPANDIQTWNNERVFLGCHAQWITPESIGEQLPFWDDARQLAITADAIIDNRDELFERLQIENSRRKTITDSELILLTYYKWGEESPRFLVGDFAYMIWDGRNQKLFGARDFSGGRTLYYFHDHRRFAFSTTIQPLLDLPYIEKKLNEQWLAEFLAIPGVAASMSPGITVYEKIKEIPPAHSISILSSNLVINRYCHITKIDKLRLRSNSEYVEAFKAVYQKAIKSQVRTYRQVGSRLSGGLDSGSVASFAAKELEAVKKKLYTFSYIPVKDFDDDWLPRSRVADERSFIQSTVNFAGNIHTSYLDFEGRNPLVIVDSILETMEMPYKFFENSYWLQGIYEQASKEDIGIILNGGRGNFTVSWGSALDYYTILFKKMQWFQLNQELKSYIQYRQTGRKKVLSIIGKRAFPLLERFFSAKAEIYQYPQVIHSDFAKRTDVYNRLKCNGMDLSAQNGIHPFESRRKHFDEVNSWNLNGTSRTKFTLKHSLWDRDPTNDLRVVQFCLSLPEEQYVKNGLDRALIRRSTEGYLPDKVRMNQQVRGLQGADGVHRMKSNWKNFIDELKTVTKDTRMQEYVNLTVIKRAVGNIDGVPTSDLMFDADFKLAMRSLILHRFLNNFA